MINIPDFKPIISLTGAAINGALKKVGKMRAVKKISKEASEKAVKAKRRAQLAKNRAVGKAHEEKVLNELANKIDPKKEVLLTQVSVRMPNGKIARPDFIIMITDPPPPKVDRIIDAKSGGAKLTKNQEKMEELGGVIIGGNAKIFKNKITVPKTTIEIK